MKKLKVVGCGEMVVHHSRAIQRYKCAEIVAR
jgi:hypothetical protein